MKTHQHGVTGWLLACAGFLALPAAAQVEIEATASNLRFVLVDLAPDDGETPWFTFADTDLSPLSVSSSVTPSESVQYMQGNAERTGSFEFSANTRLSLVLDVRTAMQALPLSTREQGGWVFTGFTAGATWGPPKDSWERFDSWEVSGEVGLYPLSTAYTTRLNREDTLWLTFDNDSDYAAWGDFRIQMGTASFSNALPVPEAPAPAMLALGLALLGLMGRRRARERLAARGDVHHIGPPKIFKLKP